MAGPALSGQPPVDNLQMFNRLTNYPGSGSRFRLRLGPGLGSVKFNLNLRFPSGHNLKRVEQ